MYAIFFTPNGLAIHVSIPKGKSMNTILKICQILTEMLTEDRHLCNMTMPQVTWPEVWRCFWKEQGVYVLEHSPYSPDLVPCDCFLFPRLKKNLAGRNIPPAKS